MPNSNVESVYYFCDESSYMKGSFMAVGGIAVPDRELTVLSGELQAIKTALGGPSEVKWSNTTSRRDSPHRAFVDHFVVAMRAKRINFHIRFAPFNEYDHAISGPRKRVDTTSKMHYQLLLHRALRFYGPHYKLHIRPDGGDCTAALQSKIDSLHRWGAAKYKANADCIGSIEPRDSQKEILLQYLDVPLGALTALRNSRELVGAKRELADYVADSFGRPNLNRNTGKNEKQFSIWNAIPNGAKRGPWG
jgi:hypothetical protein